MDWERARAQIEERIGLETDLKTARSKSRKVVRIGDVPDSVRYGYRGDTGFHVRIGKTNCIWIPWSMLRPCFAAPCSDAGYEGSFFRENFHLQADDHPCHVHVVGQIFVKAGLAVQYGTRYFLRLESSAA
jgi:hypothetical protein